MKTNAYLKDGITECSTELYVLRFALDVVERYGLEDERNSSNWVLGESLKQAIINRELTEEQENE